MPESDFSRSPDFTLHFLVVTVRLGYKASSHSSWQRLNAFNPFAQIIDTPIQLYTGAYVLREIPGQMLIQCLWIVSLVALGRYIWTRNLTRVIVQGG